MTAGERAMITKQWSLCVVASKELRDAGGRGDDVGSLQRGSPNGRGLSGPDVMNAFGSLG